MGYGSYVVGVVEILVIEGNKIKVYCIVVLIDLGYVVNFVQVEWQVVGFFVYGFFVLFYGGCIVKGGKIE